MHDAGRLVPFVLHGETVISEECTVKFCLFGGRRMIKYEYETGVNSCITMVCGVYNMKVFPDILKK